MRDARKDLDLKALRRAFDRAAATYDTAAVLQREVARRMAERLQYVKLAPARILDLGCGTGADLDLLAQRYPGARCIGCDWSVPMLRIARARTPRWRRLLRLPGGHVAQLACADVLRLPLRSDSIGLLWSNQMLHWQNDPLAAFGEMQRVLQVGGLLMFSTLGPDTLKELRQACAGEGSSPVHDFIDMHDLGDMLMAAGFAEPVMDMELITLTYGDLSELVRDLRLTASTNRGADRRRGLMGRGRWQQVRDAYERMRRDGRLAASFEVIYGHAWKPQPRAAADGRAIVRFDPPRRSSKA